MTDPEICIAALTDWPVEARPKGIDTMYQEWYDQGSISSGVFSDEIAIALFRDSGLGWLLTKNTHIELSDVGPDIGPRFGVLVHHLADREYGPTLLSAIDAAIRSIK